MPKITQVPSPFCGIGTDDITVQVSGNTVEVVENGCAVNSPAFEYPLGDSTPTIDGKAVELPAAIARAAQILQNSKQPVFSGCGSDVAGMRAIMALADCTGAVVDGGNFQVGRRNFLALQDSGWFNTTLAEVKNRCTVFVAINTDFADFAPRFLPRYLGNEAMFIGDNSRKIIYLGKPNPAIDANPTINQTLNCKDRDLPQVLAVLNALAQGHKVSVTQVGGITTADLQQLLDTLQQSPYSVLSWSAAQLDFPQADLSVQAICNLVKQINANGSRCAGLPLGGKNGEQTANQVCGWQTGYPPRLSFAAGYPEYDPFLFDTKQMLANGEADAVFWIQSFAANACPPDPNGADCVVLGRCGMQFAKPPSVFIPVGTPGIDHAGSVYRLDNVVAIRLKKLRDNNLPSVAVTLAAVLAKIQP